MSALLTYRRAAEKSIIELDHTTQLVLVIPLAHRFADTDKNIPCCLICKPKAGLTLHSRNAALILRNKVQHFKPLGQWQVASMQNGPCCDAGLVMTFATLISAIGKGTLFLRPTFWADKSLWPALRK